jgi:hypothetical protein
MTNGMVLIRRAAGVKTACGVSLLFFVVILFSVAFFAGRAEAADSTGNPHFELYHAIRNDVSPPLKEIEPSQHPRGAPRVIPLRAAPHVPFPAPVVDPVLQNVAGPLVSTNGVFNFDGVSDAAQAAQSGYLVAPPDTNGAVGDTQYVQWVNLAFAVFDKATGAKMYGPAAGDTLWSGFGGPCENDNDGDPIVQYDKAAKRWIMTQFAVAAGPPYYQCVAVSKTSDATGQYYRYIFPLAGFPDFNDYPKLGVWPDAYYMSFNMFQPPSSFFSGAKACAMERSKMLIGDQTAGMQCFQFDTSVDSLLPSDLDGTTAPPAGSPDYFMNFGSNSLNLWAFHVDWTNPSLTIFTGPVTIPVAAFGEACNGGTCIPQYGTSQKLDSLGDRLMYRLAYRNFGDHESLVVNHSVTAGNSVGVRWYEIRNPGTTPTMYQQGTYAPDSNYRWMGSIAMDKAGNIALGYSVSSSSMYPAVRYTGRVPADALGTMEAESSIIEGTGSQTRSLSRWGDYSAISVDPVDDCTFWYTNQYLKSSGTFNWSTRIVSFRFPSCGTPPATYSISGTITQSGGGALSGVTVTLSGDATGTTTTDSNGNYSFTGLANGGYTITPSMTGYTFSPTSIGVTVNNADVSGRNFTATATLPPATYSISGTITQSGGGALSGVTVTLSGDATGTTATDGSGTYTFSGLSNGTYTVTPSGKGYTYSPTSLPVTVNNADATGQNFTGQKKGGGGGHNR